MSAMAKTVKDFGLGPTMHIRLSLVSNANKKILAMFKIITTMRQILTIMSPATSQWEAVGPATRRVTVLCATPDSTSTITTSKQKRQTAKVAQTVSRAA